MHITVYDAHNGRKEGNVLCNDALNTFYLQIYGIRHVVKDHPYRERGNLLPLLFPINSNLLYAPSHRQDSTYHSLCYTSRRALDGRRNSSMGPMKDRSDDPSHHERTLLPRSYISLHNCCNDAYILLQVTLQSPVEEMSICFW